MMIEIRVFSVNAKRMNDEAAARSIVYERELNDFFHIPFLFATAAAAIVVVAHSTLNMAHSHSHLDQK